MRSDEVQPDEVQRDITIASYLPHSIDGSGCNH
jgi:hypothetical protein